MMCTEFFRFETIMLDSIKLFADGRGMSLSNVANALEICTVRLSSLS